MLVNAGATAFAAGVFLHAGPAVLAASAAGQVLAVHKRLRDRGRVALTFDDGPQPQALERFLDVLDEHQARATFFLVGERAVRHPDLVQRIRAAGHSVANHGFTHRNHLFFTPRAAALDIQRGAAVIAEITGERPTLYRPPYGIVAGATSIGARRARHHLVLWSRWGRDWRARATAQSITMEATKRLGGGDIVLLHDADYYGSPGAWRNTLTALPRIIDHIRGLGLELGRIGDPGELA